jgi:hypothetical protein
MREDEIECFGSSQYLFNEIAGGGARSRTWDSWARVVLRRMNDEVAEMEVSE